jgi:hypothetical protein
MKLVHATRFFGGFFAVEIADALCRFLRNDWGDTCQSDKAMNDQALTEKERIVALYKTSKGKVFIIKEYGHETTTILFASEY